MKLGQAGDRCLSQKGSAAGIEDVAARGAIAASSAADVAAHGANMAVDGGSTTFWVCWQGLRCGMRRGTCFRSFCQASEMDPAGPVELTVDVGSQKKVSAVNVDWEFPAKSFTLSVSVDGVKWSEVHSTDSNILDSNHIPLGLVSATNIKLVMHQARKIAAHRTKDFLSAHVCV